MAVVKCGTPASMLSSSVAFRASGSHVEQLGAVSLPGIRTISKSHRSVAIRASHKPEEESSVIRSKVLVALVAAGASLTLDVAAPVWPAHAGLPFRGSDKVERGATAPQFPGNEGTGTKVGQNSRVRGSANRGTPLGEGAGGNLVGDNRAIRQASSRGTTLGEGRLVPRQATSQVARQASSAGTEVGEGRSSDGEEGAQNLIESGKELASSDDAQKVKDAAGDVAKGAVQGAVTKAAQDFATSQLGVPGVAATAATQLVTKVVTE
ncbi:hypothetical protein KC19_11G059400 [Ceratodon purpureus]|uniref:Uncharacterized protein n=1 Tax=Ceratodon purpureus TaxID=3225 RepID=A0A8T0GCQ5_CERPU|nr:hypothetical protein KC19_11G059400 [Ceratodon purpureus]